VCSATESILLPNRTVAAAAVLALAAVSNAGAYDVNDELSIGGILAGGYQYDGDDRQGGAAGTFRPHLDFRPTNRDELFVKLGFSAGNAINDTTQFALAPWDADLENDVKNINGRSRDYLLTAWYKHTFTVDRGTDLGVTGGLIDSWDYLDLNAYANDEYDQFMNEAFVNAPIAFLPSYDYGGALELVSGPFTTNAVLMKVGANDDGRGYWFWGLQFGYKVTSKLGAGNYRFVIDSTSKEFLDPQGVNEEPLLGLTFSFDQELTATVGAFVRIGWQQDDAEVDFDAQYSGGLNISGGLWKRPRDNIGIGYAYLSGGNGDVGDTRVVEVYARFKFGKYVALTTDLQYMDEETTTGDLSGWIPGVRLVVEF
jgi:hypothetical protein